MNCSAWTAIVFACAAASCGGTESSQDVPESTVPQGTVKLQFAVSDGARNNYLVDPLLGTVYGDLYLPQDVDPQSNTGRIPGAVAVGRVRVDGVDLRYGAVSQESWNASLPTGKYAFLGFFDLDANAAVPAYPDKGDPVITPAGALSQVFDVQENQPTTQTITFDLTLWCPVIDGKLDCGN